MSWSTLHNGDMSSNVFENFTTYKRDIYDHSWQQQYFAKERSCDLNGKSWTNGAVMQELRGLTGESMSSRRSTEQRSHCSRVKARCMIFLTIFSKSVCSSNRSLTTSSRACGTTDMPMTYGRVLITIMGNFFHYKYLLYVDVYSKKENNTLP